MLYMYKEPNTSHFPRTKTKQNLRKNVQRTKHKPLPKRSQLDYKAQLWSYSLDKYSTSKSHNPIYPIKQILLKIETLRLKNKKEIRVTRRHDIPYWHRDQLAKVHKLGYVIKHCHRSNKLLRNQFNPIRLDFSFSLTLCFLASPPTFLSPSADTEPRSLVVPPLFSL